MTNPCGGFSTILVATVDVMSIQPAAAIFISTQHGLLGQHTCKLHLYVCVCASLGVLMQDYYRLTHKLGTPTFT